MFQKPSSDIALNQQPIHTPQHVEDTVETVVGPSVHVEGDFASEGDIIVKGTVSGNVKTSRLLKVESGAKIFASVSAGSANISGDVQGNVIVSGRVDITETAMIQGDIRCDVLAIEPGARIHGKIIMDGVDIGEPTSPKKRSLGRVKPKKEEDDTEAEE